MSCLFLPDACCWLLFYKTFWSILPASRFYAFSLCSTLWPESSSFKSVYIPLDLWLTGLAVSDLGLFLTFLAIVPAFLTLSGSVQPVLWLWWEWRTDEGGAPTSLPERGILTLWLGTCVPSETEEIWWAGGFDQGSPGLFLHFSASWLKPLLRTFPELPSSVLSLFLSFPCSRWLSSLAVARHMSVWAVGGLGSGWELYWVSPLESSWGFASSLSGCGPVLTFSLATPSDFQCLCVYFSRLWW